MIAPAEMTKISASEGAVFSGTACSDDQIWILDFDPTDGYFYQTNESPLGVSGSGEWQFLNSQIGSEEDERGAVYSIVVIRASSACTAALRSMPRNEEGVVKFTPLPASCPAGSNSADRKTVHVVNDGP